MKEYHVLNLGAGVQSSALALLSEEGRVPKFDAAIFADTGEEPQDPGENVYDHLTWLRSKLSYPVLIRSKNKALGDCLLAGQNSPGGRFASIPAFTKSDKGKIGVTRRQCTREFKIEVVEKSIRQDILGLRKYQRIPKDVLVHQYIGISLDEAGRMLRAKKRAEEDPRRWSAMHYPLCETLLWTRKECREFLASRVPHRVPRSACTFCPYHSNEEWQKLKDRNGRDWARAVAIDKILRTEGAVVNRNMTSTLWLHRSCLPLDEIDFTKDQNGDKSMAGECQGMCGN